MGGKLAKPQFTTVFAQAASELDAKHLKSIDSAWELGQFGGGVSFYPQSEEFGHSHWYIELNLCGRRI